MHTEQSRRVREAASYEGQREVYCRRNRGLVAPPSVDEDVQMVRDAIVGNYMAWKANEALDRLVARIPTATNPDPPEAA
jgi:hypothetical protein